MKKGSRFFAVLFLFGILFFSSCTDAVFKTSQPKGVVNLGEFPESLRGNYSSIPTRLNPAKADSRQLNIDNRIIALTVYTWEKLPASDSSEIAWRKQWKPAASAFEIKTYSYFLKSDTFYFITKEIHYYALGKEIILRKMDNIYFLNFSDTIRKKEKSAGYWEVMTLNLSSDGILNVNDGTLAFHTDPSKKIRYDSSGNEIYMTREESVNYFSKITPIKLVDSKDHIYLLDPDSNQLKKLVDKGFFVNLYSFKKRN